MKMSLKRIKKQETPNKKPLSGIKRTIPIIPPIQVNLRCEDEISNIREVRTIDDINDDHLKDINDLMKRILEEKD